MSQILRSKICSESCVRGSREVGFEHYVTRSLNAEFPRWCRQELDNEAKIKVFENRKFQCTNKYMKAGSAKNLYLQTIKQLVTTLSKEPELWISKNKPLLLSPCVAMLYLFFSHYQNFYERLGFCHLRTGA